MTQDDANKTEGETRGDRAGEHIRPENPELRFAPESEKLSTDAADETLRRILSEVAREDGAALDRPLSHGEIEALIHGDGGPVSNASSVASVEDNADLVQSQKQIEGLQGVASENQTSASLSDTLPDQADEPARNSSRPTDDGELLTQTDPEALVVGAPKTQEEVVTPDPSLIHESIAVSDGHGSDAQPLSTESQAPLRQEDLEAIMLRGLVRPSMLSETTKGISETFSTESALSESTESTETKVEIAEIDKRAIEALLADNDADKALVGPDGEVSLVEDQVPLAQEDLDALILTATGMDARLAPARPDPPKAEEQAPPAPTPSATTANAIKPSSSLSSEPTASVQPSSVVPRELVSSENLAAAAGPSSVDSGALPQDLLDSIVQQAQQASSKKSNESGAAVSGGGLQSRDVEGSATTDEAFDSTEGTTPARRRRSLVLLLPEHPLKISAAIAAGFIVGVSTFTYLYLNRIQEPDNEILAAAPQHALSKSADDEKTSAGSEDIVEHPMDLGAAMIVARQAIDEGAYGKAAKLLRKTIAAAPPSSERTDADFLRLEAIMRGLPAKVSDAITEQIHGEIENLLDAAQSHPRAPEALAWNAKLYEREGLPQAAAVAYSKIFTTYAADPNLDVVLMDASRIALNLKRPSEARDYLHRLLEEFPGSTHALDAKMMLARAYQDMDDFQSARTLYTQLAQAQLGTSHGSHAFEQLGMLAYEVGDYGEAIRNLELKLETATSVEGNDKTYLKLARAYRKKGSFDDARRVLQDLIDFFPDSPSLADAHIELSQVLDQLGKREDAVRVALQAQQMFRDFPDVHRNAGDMLARTGDHGLASEAYLAADKNGAGEPKVLLLAGQQFRMIDDVIEAMAAYEKIVKVYPDSPEAVEAQIDVAHIYLDLGQPRKALATLEELTTAAKDKTQRLPVKISLAEMYFDLGLYERASVLFKEIATETTEPDMLARAAIAMMSSGLVDDGLLLASRVDETKIPDSRAYELLTIQGEHLLDTADEKAVELLERASDAYPSARTPAGDLTLLKGYLKSDRTQKSRALVMSMKARAAINPIELPAFVGGARHWADHLFKRKDFRAAADAYQLIVDNAPPKDPNLDWSRFQYANASLELGDYKTSAPLFEALARAKSEWSDEARTKADFIRVEQGIRGERVATDATG